MKYVSLMLFVVLFSSCKGENTPNTKTATKQPEFAKYFNKEWANNKFWYDGLAEVAVYKAQRKIYNKVRDFDYTYITVAEDFNKAFTVKTDDYNRKDLFKVMKVNAFCNIQTDNYPYHFLTSMFLNFNTPWAITKMTNGSQEWCGNTFKEYIATDKNIAFTYHSYWDNEGDGKKEMDSNILFEDQLNYTLRSLNFKPGLRFEGTVLESQISSKVGKLKTFNATFLVEDGITDIADTPSWKIIVKLDAEKTNTYYIGKAYPNVLLKQQTWDGRNLQLNTMSRYAYWQK
jgi:hypothetical protein